VKLLYLPTPGPELLKRPRVFAIAIQQVPPPARVPCIDAGCDRMRHLKHKLVGILLLSSTLWEN